ncbi:MAG TPA: hypothetical protein VKU81_04285 [Casimicrobiaceae bacterium]|nr:hypothetical protein [Casimicrobiaceae bacterium]
MAHRSDSNCISTEREYGAARRELDALLGSAGDLPDECRIDELIKLIENYEASVRFVPDWSDESYRNAA